jgi:DNA-binding XRE family transcriptional regulator
MESWDDYEEQEEYAEDDGFKIQKGQERRNRNKFIRARRNQEDLKPINGSYSTEYNPTIIISPKLREKVSNMINESIAKENEEIQKSLMEGMLVTDTTENVAKPIMSIPAYQAPPSRYPNTNTKNSDKYKFYTRKMGLKVAQRRTEMNLSQEELATKIGVDAQTIINIERGGLVSFNRMDILTRLLFQELNMTLAYEE